MTTRKALSNELIDSSLLDYKKLEGLIGENGLLKQLTKVLIERALQVEMTEHLGHSLHVDLEKFQSVGRQNHL